MKFTSCFLLLFLPLSLSQVIWTKPNSWNTGLPSSIEVFQTNSSYTEGVPMTGAYSKMNLSDPDLVLKVVHAEGANLKTPQQFIDEEPNLVYMAVNGGYFDMSINISISLIISDGQVIAGGCTEVRENFGGHVIPYYPTRGAFGVYPNGTMEVAYTYNVGDASDIYAYPQASPNCFGCPPQFVPTSTFPQNGTHWEVTQAVGAGPVIIKDGVRNANISMNQELFALPDRDARNPRTGICISDSGELIVVVIDGRYSLSGGLFIDELGGLMKDLGCRDALNLDGGGSTAMIVNGFLTNHPSDPDGMRPLTSAILLVSKSKPKGYKERGTEEAIPVMEDFEGFLSWSSV